MLLKTLPNKFKGLIFIFNFIILNSAKIGLQMALWEKHLKKMRILRQEQECCLEKLFKTQTKILSLDHCIWALAFDHLVVPKYSGIDQDCVCSN